MNARQQFNLETGVGAGTDARLFRAMVEDLRIPLLQIARRSELAQLEATTNYSYETVRQIEATADAALKLIDSYIFSTQVLLAQQTLPLEPVSLGATLNDTAQYMSDIAKIYNYELEVVVSNRCGLVMANPRGLQAALISLAYAFIGGIASEKSSKILLTARKTASGVSAGVMMRGQKISKRALGNARQTFGSVRQPLAENSHTSSAGIYVADSLFAAMNAELRTASVRGSSGLVATLLPSYQLALL